MIFENKLRVRYAETDRMGYCYYGNFAAYFEVARVEALRSLGISYKKLEDDGIILPVLDYQIKYFKPAFYDEELRIETTIDQVKGVRILFSYKTFNEKNEQINQASSTLVFVDFETKKPLSPPAYLLEILSNAANN
ncbi:MAG: acyl-CoA thioesterase [Salibacteraceae bacterium]|jgi:acyl-CoA thioester hydrolase|nr:acyl-CoA thioesterase [Salibacteraceae bacterium]MDP4844783.1 acyl-CoA thioesterase [Salibacteraceae bacterium]MDP4935467.1 acyl-CoA thioesterase [Salibacteraceae bacterium]